MATKFSDIYKRAVFKIKDYSFLKTLSDVKEAVFLNYLLSSIVDLEHDCTKYNLEDYDIDAEEFREDLDNEVIEILATGCAFHWLDMETLNNKLMKNRILKSDYSTYSPANLLQTLTALRDTYRSEYYGMIHIYSMRNGGIESLKT